MSEKTFNPKRYLIIWDRKYGSSVIHDNDKDQDLSLIEVNRLLNKNDKRIAEFLSDLYQHFHFQFKIKDLIKKWEEILNV